MRQGKRIDQLEVGDVAELTKTVTESDVVLFAKVTGDVNPVHLDEAYARNSLFKGRVAHGMLSAGFISAVLGTLLPGVGTIYLHQELDFLAPVRLGDTITARVEIIEIRTAQHQVRLRTDCLNQKGKKVVEGEALVLVPGSKDDP